MGWDRRDGDEQDSSGWSKVVSGTDAIRRALGGFLLGIDKTLHH